jgi:excisionase family DNA binding protein
MAKLYTTGQAAKAVRVTRQTLQNWISSGKIAPPKPIGRTRVWTRTDVMELGRIKKRIYGKGKGRGRKPKSKR